jgi:hypothetical protein
MASPTIHFAHRRTLGALGFCVVFLAACGDDTDPNPASATTGSPPTTGSTSSGMGGAGGTGGTGGAGGEGGAVPPPDLEQILEELRADRDAALSKYADSESGWPVALAEGHLFVTADVSQTLVAGDHDAWAGTPMAEDSGFRWVVIQVPADDHYKFVSADYKADPWSRSFNYDEFGEISIVAPTAAHLDRFFGVGDTSLEPRTLQIWVPQGGATHVLYVHDGQNLFNPDAFFGGWRLQETVPPGMLLVGINNTGARFDEYTHVPDDIDVGQIVGGQGDAYADYLQNTIRPMIASRYGGEPPKVGVMGSSLGGLISLHIADRAPGVYDFAASLSGTLGWGSIGLMNETLIERHAAHGHQSTVLYVDSGGAGDCFDSDGDGIEDDDPNASDNYCENVQLQGVLLGVGYTEGVDLHSFWEPGALHNEAAWAARVPLPFGIFAGL